MKSTLRLLLNHVLDYAGLFPPAQLTLESAVQNYAAYLQSPDSWLLSRFVCPVQRLPDLAPLLPSLFRSAAPCRIAALGAADPLTPDFVLDIRALDQFGKLHGSIARVEALESRISAQTIADWDPDAVAEGLNVLATKLVEHDFGALAVFLEPVFDAGFDQTIRNVVAALERHDEERGDPAPTRIGLKLRVAGTQPATCPSPAHVARMIVACRDANIPLKFTAGLHHAFPSRASTDPAPGHGFVNVFVAGVLSAARGLNEPELCDVLAEQDSQAFAFDEQSLRWRRYEATLDDIGDARRELVLSFGSCSFDEPRTELRALGWLD